MTEQVFYRKWRPQAFSEVVGQEHVTKTLLNALASERVAHAYLFCGPRGTGKTSTGRILAKAVNCLQDGKGEPCNSCAMCVDVSEGRALDLIEIDAASNRGIDEIRSLREKVGFAPNVARSKVYIIDEVHMLTTPAFNALLKTLEEPPPHTILVLATTEAHKLPATIISRCQRFDLKRISRDDVVRRLSQICESEAVQVTEEALGLIARSSGGSLRDAENMLEQLAVGVGDSIDEDLVRVTLGIGDRDQMRSLAHAALNLDLAEGLNVIETVVGQGVDLSQFQRELTAYLRDLMLVKAMAASGSELSDEERSEARTVLAEVSLDRLVMALRGCGSADVKDPSMLALPLEMALLDVVIGSTGQDASLTPLVRSQPARGPAPQRREAKPSDFQTPREPSAAVPTDPEATTSVTDANDGEQLSVLIDRWKEVVAASKGKGQKFKLDVLLRSGSKPVAVQDETVLVGFTHQKFVSMMREELENPASRKSLEEALATVLGSRYRVQCVVSSQEPKNKGGHLIRAAVQEAGAKPVEGGDPPP